MIYSKHYLNRPLNRFKRALQGLLYAIGLLVMFGVIVAGVILFTIALMVY